MQRSPTNFGSQNVQAAILPLHQRFIFFPGYSTKPPYHQSLNSLPMRVICRHHHHPCTLPVRASSPAAPIQTPQSSPAMCSKHAFFYKCECIKYSQAIHRCVHRQWGFCATIVLEHLILMRRRCSQHGHPQRHRKVRFAQEKVEIAEVVRWW